MVKRTPPLAVAVIGTGETPVKNVEALLNDYTSPYAEVTFVLPVDDEHWTPTIQAVLDWAVANEIPYVAVTDGSSPSKALVPVLEGAESTIKVARVSTKLVSLLVEEKAEGDVALLVAWDDDDAEASTAVTKALSSEVTALNLCDGLDPFEFDDEDGAGDDGEVAQPPAGRAAAAEPDDEYDAKGIRALRALLRERDGHGLSDKQIGQLEKPDAIKALRKLDAGGDEPPAEEPDEPKEETRTTRARRAFAEGAAEGSGDEAQALPRSRGADILDNEGGDPEPTEAATAGGVADGPFEETGLRHRALELAISGGKTGADAIADAIKYATYLKGERQSGGRPRADGSPAQPREIGEDGKPVRRRRASSTE